MSKAYAIGDLYTGMRISLSMSLDVWEIEEINYDLNDVSFILVKSPLLTTGMRASDRYTYVLKRLNEEYYVEVPEETFEIET